MYYPILFTEGRKGENIPGKIGSEEAVLWKKFTRKVWQLYEF